MSLQSKLSPLEIALVCKEWVYRSEGNANMVFAYNGGSKDLQGWLLRVSKHPTPTDMYNTETSKDAGINTASQDKIDSITYYTKIVGQLVGEKYVLPQRLIVVTKEFLTGLSTSSNPLRPQNRIHKQIDTQQRLAILILDMTSSPTKSLSENGTVTVELKPKWGFLPTSKYISTETAIKYTVCRYCIHQYTKHNGAKVSDFCPLDLYSTSRKRVSESLDCLLQSPQNNMCVFFDGNDVTASLKSNPSMYMQWNSIRDQVTDILINDGVLVRLGSLQRSLDSLDIEGLYPLFKQEISNGMKVDSQPSIKDFEKAIDRFTLKGDDDISNWKAMIDFLLSKTLKDISILIRLSPAHPSIAIIDADIKELSKIPEYYEKDKKIVLNYLACKSKDGFSKVCTA